MRFILFRAIAALTFLAGLSGLCDAASFQISGVAPIATIRGVSPPALTAAFTVLNPGTTGDWAATLEGNPAWASLSSSNGSGAGSLTITLATTSLVTGTFSSALLLNSGGTLSRQAFTVTVIQPNVVKMEADLTRPMIYALHKDPAAANQPGYLIFLNTVSEKVERVIPVGTNPTDLDISYPEGVIYITNHGAADKSIRVVDPVTAKEVRSLNAGTDAYKINAGKKGRIVIEGLDQWIGVYLLNSATGASITDGGFQREGDAEFDPSGRYYYHADNNISNAHLTRYDLAADTFSAPVVGVQRAYGTRNLIMSGDGSRLFWNRYLYDRDLNELRAFSTEIYSCTFRGEIAFGIGSAFNVTTGAVLASLPISSNVQAVSGDQLKLFQFNAATGGFTRTLMSAIGPVPPPVAAPQPANDGFIFTPLSRLQWSSAAGALKYQVYFGTDAAAVAAALPASPLYLGETDGLFKTLPSALAPGTAYYWRVDPVGFSGVTAGAVWRFTTSSLEVSPNSLTISLPRGSLPQSLAVTTSSAAAGPWTATESLSWLSLSAPFGTSGDTLTATFNPAGLAAGIYTGEISLAFGGTTARLPVRFELFDLGLTKMIADPGRPWIYGLHPGSMTSPASYVVLINTDTKQITGAIPVGIGATDLTINHQEGKLYINNWQGTSIQVINLERQTLLPPLPSGRDVYKLNAGRAGRLYAEGQNQWINMSIIDSNTGRVLPAVSGTYREGDGEVDPSGRYYYHCENDSSGAALRKLDISADIWTLLKSGPVIGYGTRNLVMSPDGTRLFWQTQVYDQELNVLRNLGAEIYATTQRGELAFSNNQVFNTGSGAVISTLPVASTVSTVSGDQSVFCYFNDALKSIGFVSMASIAPVPPPGTNGQPSGDSVQLSPVARLTWDVVASGLKYRVYFGRDAAQVAAATPASAQYLGETLNAFWDLAPASIPLGGQYFWRVDPVGLTATSTGSVLSFRTLAVTVSSLAVDQRSLTGAPPQSVKLAVSGGAPGTPWMAATTGSPWLSVATPSGLTGDTLELMLTPGSLPAGNFTGSVTLSAGSRSAVIPVKFSIEAPAYAALMADPARPRLYALQRPATLTGSLVVINSITSAIERVIPLSSNPTGFDLTPDGQFIYIVTIGGRKMHRINLTDWSTAERPLVAVTDHSIAFLYRVAAGAGSKVYWTDGEWAPKLHSLDFATGTEAAPAILADSSNGFGSIARKAAGTGLAALTQYGWYSGSNATALNLTTSGASASVNSAGVSMNRDALNAPVLVRADGSATFMNKYKLSPDLTKIEAEYPAPVYAVTPGRGIVFGATQAWKERTRTQVWQAPAGVNAQICAVTGDASAFYYFNTGSNSLVRVEMGTISDVPGPQPEDGEVVEAMPSSLSWTPRAGALRYEVYLGTDPAAVLAASGLGSPLYLGSATTASLPVDLSFRTAGILWWRVDTVLAGSTTKGPVWKFSGALSYLGLIKGSNGGYSTIAPALAMEGTTILSGYGSASTDFSSPGGQVLVHVKRNGLEEWELVQRIDKPATSSASAGFGTAIAMKGDTAWISAPGDGTGGRVHEFRQESTTRRWLATGRMLQSPAPVTGDSFGSSLSFDGTVIAVGLTGASLNPNYLTGAVEIFDAITLARHVRITEANSVSNARFGGIMALGDGILAIGSPARTVSGLAAGAIDIWTRGSGTTWTRTSTISCPSPASNRGFGSALALSGDRLYTGTYSELSAGKVFSYQKTTGTGWTLLNQIPRTGSIRTDTYANSLALSGDLLAIGAPSTSSSTPEVSGDVWLHRNLGASGWTAVSPAVPAGNATLKRYGVSLALTKRYLVTGYLSDGSNNGGFTIHLHDPAGNLPPYVTSSPVVFAEVGRPYQYTLTGADENPGDIPTATAVSALPAWLSLTPSGNGSAILAGTPPVGAEGDVAIRLRLQDAGGDLAEQNFTIRVQPPGSIPLILATTGDQTMDDGKPLTLGVTVEPGTPVTYQWYQNGVALSGQTGATLFIGNVQSSDAGSYQVRVTRSGIWMETAPMLLTINQVPDRFGGDWPTFGATTSHAGTYPATLGKHKLLPAWNIPQTGSNPVVTGGGRIYSVQGGYFAEGGSVSAYTAVTGVRLWTSPLPVSSSVNPPTYHRGKVYMQRGKNTNDTPDLRCYDAATGVLQWKSTFGAQWENYFAPTVDDTGIYVNGGYGGGLYHFGFDGTEIFFNSSLAQFDNWTPLLHLGKLYSWVSGTFTNHELQSGNSIYSLTVPWEWRGYGMNTVPAAEGNLAVMRSTTEVFAVDLAARRVLWKKAGNFRGSPALKNGIAYVIGTAGVETFDALTGTSGRLYRTRNASNIDVMPIHQPVLLEDTLVVSSDNLIWSFDLASGSLLQRMDGGGALTYSDGILLASGTDSTLRAWKVNQPVRLTAPVPVMAAVEDVPFNWELQVADPDADVPSISITGLPAWLTAAPLQEGVIRFSGTPLNSLAGSFSINVVANDLKSFPSTVVIRGTVTPVNDQPVASNRTLDRSEDAPAEDIVLTDLFSDEETPGAALKYTILSNSGSVVGASLDSPADTTLRITYPADVFGQAAITVRATDPEGLFADAVITITVAPVNDSPAGFLDPLVLDEDAAAVDFNLDDFFGDIETADNGLVFQVASTDPAVATAVLSEHVLRITPQPNANGGITVNIRCQDPEGAFVDFSLPVNLRPVNDIPTGGLTDLTVDEDSPPVVIDLAAAFADIETPDSALRFTAIASAPAVVQSTLSGSLMTLTPQKDANGSLFVSVACTDADGGLLDVSFNVNVRPVNDPPVLPAVLPAIAAGDAGADAVIDFLSLATDPDRGDALTWRVVSNSNPGLFTRIDFDSQGRLTIHYAPYVSGQAVVVVEVRDQAGTSAQRSFTVDLPVLPAPAVETTGSIVINRQTGLWEQRVTVKNTGRRAIGGFEISVTGLPAGASLYNASGSQENRFLAASYQPLAPGASLVMVLEYYVPSRLALNPQLVTKVLLPQNVQAAASAGGVSIDRMDMMEPGAFLLEFTAVPGELYQVQYSSGEGWVDSLVRIRAAGNRVQWIDRGAPRTSSPPQAGKARFYRVKHLAVP